MQKFMDREFWKLQERYSAAKTDATGARIEVQIGGRAKAVGDYAESAPRLVQTLEFAIDDAADTHRWRHGNPRNEPLRNIEEDGRMAKLGVTVLMRDAASGDEAGQEMDLASGPELEAVDSSGWTALMYAAASPYQSVETLLKAGANPNHKSPRGDTPLMASAITGYFCEELVQAGARINAQNSAGITALMILAANGDADEVKDALTAGADPRIRDAQGRSAIDHLHLACRGKSPIFHDRESDSMNEEDVHNIEQLLNDAARTMKQ